MALLRHVGLLSQTYLDFDLTRSLRVKYDGAGLERSMSRSLRFPRLISRKGDEVGHVVLLNTNRKSYIESPIAPSYLTLSDLVSQSQGHSNFEYVVKEPR